MKTNSFSRFAKATAFAAFVIIACTMSAFAKPLDVNRYIMSKFQNQFKNASNVSWKESQEFTSATFIQNGEKTSVFYDASNNLISITKEISVEDLPTVAQETIATKYKNYTVDSVINYLDGNGIMSYYVKLNRGNKSIILKSDIYGYLNFFQQ